ncbi:MAG: DEAD/DEAH box helicase family protein [Clostridiales bacterium]|nr:DEAD/DEAH box helicase family protein [Clostridiales bacterium]
MPIKAIPYAHQVEAFNFVCDKFGLGRDSPISTGTALLMEMGTGKTITTIAVIGALAEARAINKVLIVAPLSIVGVWQEEFAKFAEFSYELTVLSGSSSKKAEKLKQMQGRKLQVAVINYESAWRLEKELLGWNADIIVADEGHKIKTHNISAAKTMHKLGAKAKYKMLLTGTIITNKAIDVFSQYKFINPAVFGNSFYIFRNRYFDMTGYGNYTPVLKQNMEKELSGKIHSIAFRTTKAQCLDLPITTDIVRTVELEPSAMKIYKDLVKDSYAQLVTGTKAGTLVVTATNVLTRLLRLSQLTGGFVGDDEGNTPQKISSAKRNALEDIIETVLNEGKKVVVIARFVAEIKAIEKMLVKKQVGYSLIMGGVKDRDLQVLQFQNDPNVQVFIGQIATAGLGITLTSASTMVFYSLDYSMSNFEQTKARIHRVGQKENCTYIYLIAKDTVDSKVLLALQDKADLAKMLVDDYKNGANPFQVKGSQDGK